MNLSLITEVLNAEGTILQILKDDKESLFVQGLTDNGTKKILARTNHFILSLYYRSRISLKDLYLLNQDSSYIIIEGGQAVERFFEISTDTLPQELTNLSCGNDLYGLLPKNMKSNLTLNEILELLPKPISDDNLEEIENLKIFDADVSFFGEGPVQVVTVLSEKYNDDEHDYIMCFTWDGRRVLTRINPYSLFLFMNNRLSIKELFKCRQDDSYYIIDEDSTFQSRYSEEIEVILKNLRYSDLTYFSLPAKFQIENPIENWKFYTDYITISGRGSVLSQDSNQISPIKVQIK